MNSNTWWPGRHARRRLTTILSVFVMLMGGLFAVSAQPAQARTGLSVGMTVKQEELSVTWQTFQGYHIDSVRVFSGTTPPPWSDARIQFLKSKSSVPFISFKTVISQQALRDYFLAMPADIPRVYATWFHEPEADMSAATFKTQHQAYYTALSSLPATLRAKIKWGPVQTKQWTENGGNSYATYDPGPSYRDYWGVDAYMNSWIADYPDHVAWMQQIVNYNTGGDPKWIPELGAVSLPHDDSDVERALFIDRVTRLIEANTQFGLVLWWQTDGTSGSHINGLCTARDFRLNHHRECTTNPPQAPVYTVTAVEHSETVWKLFQNRNSP